MSKVLILPGDGIGKEIVAQALKVIDYLNENHNLGMELIHGLVGGSAYDEKRSSSDLNPNKPISGLKSLGSDSHS